MTVKEFIEYLQTLPPDMIVLTFSPFDGNGPCDWVQPVLREGEGVLKISDD